MAKAGNEPGSAALETDALPLDQGGGLPSNCVCVCVRARQCGCVCQCGSHTNRFQN